MTEAPDSAPPPATPASDPNAAKGPLFEFNRPTVVALFYLATYFTVFSGVIGVVLAYIWRSERHAAWEAAHYPYLIRTFWLGLAALGAVALACLAVLVATTGLAHDDGAGVLAILAAAMLLPLVALWLLVRSLIALVGAQNRQPVKRPYSWLA